MRESTISVSKGYNAPGTDLQVSTAPTHSTLVFKQKSAYGAGFAPKAVSLWTVNGPFLFFAKKENWGIHPRAAKRRILRPQPGDTTEKENFYGTEI